MEVSVGFDTRELTALTRHMLSTAQELYPNESKTFVREESQKLKQRLYKAYQSGTNKHTGNLLKGVNKSSPQLYEKEWQARVRNRAHHAPLIEHGHEKWIHGVDTGEKVPGKHIAAETTNAFKDSYTEDADHFVDKLLDKGFAL